MVEKLDETARATLATKLPDWQLEGEWLLDHRVSDCGRYLALIAFAEAPAVPHRLCVADLQQRVLLEFAQRPLIAGLLVTFGIPAEGIGIVLGVDRILDMARTTTNVGADLVTAAVVDVYERKVDVSST